MLTLCVCSTDPSLSQVQLGNLSSDHLMLLAENGLREKYREPFEKYDRRIEDIDAAWPKAEGENEKAIDERIQQDIPMIEQEVRRLVRRSYQAVYR